MDRTDQSMNRSTEQGSQQRDSMHGSNVDRGMSDRSTSNRGMSGSERQGGYGDETGRSMSGSGVEGGNRNDPRTGTTANQTGSNRPSDEDRMQGRPSEVVEDDGMEGGSSQGGGSMNR